MPRTGGPGVGVHDEERGLDLWDRLQLAHNQCLPGFQLRPAAHDSVSEPPRAGGRVDPMPLGRVDVP